jgi:hypothetical protein
MKYAILAALLAISSTASAGQRVNGYTRSDGTYVQPYYRSAPDSSNTNNYSYQGNVNPYTGQTGHNTYGGRTTNSYGSNLGGYQQPCYGC